MCIDQLHFVMKWKASGLLNDLTVCQSVQRDD